jgi:hypothetical protein
MTRLLNRIKERVTGGRDNTALNTRLVSLPPPALTSELTNAESRLGFELPLLLKTLYMEIANGGFGPGDGFVGVPSHNSPRDQDIVQAFQDCSRRPRLQWPAQLLPVNYCGCDVFFCIDCADATNRIVMFDGDLGDLEECDISEPRSLWPYPDHSMPACFRTRAQSFEDFLDLWLADETQLYQW